MQESMRARLAQMQDRLTELDALLSAPNATADLNRYRNWTRDHSELTPVVRCYEQWLAAQADLEAAREMADEPAMRDFAAEEVQAAQQRMRDAAAALQVLLLPRDPNDDRNVLLEIRAGTGGEESALFAADLLRMYLRHAERKGWQVEVMSASASDLKGYKEVILRIAGDQVYSRLKFESGGHRVQRVPATEAQGRIHTSACTVAVMAEADELGDIDIRTEDLRIDVFRASGAGGQHVNKTESAVRIVHLPTGMVAECQDDRSQHRNKEKAMAVLRTRLMAKRQTEASAQEAAQRKGLIGSGDRSDRIRTYNFPQGRMTDHRINLTLYKLDAIMDGDLQELLDALTAAHQAEQLAALGEDAA